MKERKRARQTAIAPRGHTLRTRRTEAARPAATRAVSAASPTPTPAPAHSRVGTSQNRDGPGRTRATARRYAPAGRMPRGPIRPWIWKARE